MVRYLAIVCIFVLVLAEMFFSGSGAFRSNPVFEYALVLACIGVAVIAFEGICMHEYSRLSSRNDDRRAIALSLWTVCFVLGMLFTTVGIKARGEANQAIKVAGWTKRDNVEQSTAELTEKRRILTDTVKGLSVANLTDGVTTWKLRPIGSVENDGRYKSAKNCADAKTAGQRTVCQEHSMASTLAAKEGELKETEAKLEASRNRLDNTDVVVSKTATDAGIFVDMGMSPKAASYVIAGIVAILLHGVTSFGFFIIPRLDDDEQSTVSAGTAPSGHASAVHVHVGHANVKTTDQDGIVSTLNPVTGRIDLQRVMQIPKGLQ
jgi:hypothetical protein